VAWPEQGDSRFLLSETNGMGDAEQRRAVICIPGQQDHSGMCISQNCPSSSSKPLVTLPIMRDLFMETSPEVPGRICTSFAALWTLNVMSV
jgi:hypothetical protein